MDQNEPTTYQEAITSPDFEKWLEAMKSKMESMKINNIWTLVDPPEGIKLIGCKWIFKKKRSTDRQVETYKAHLVAKRYRQRYGIDYDEMFFLVKILKSN